MKHHLTFTQRPPRLLLPEHLSPTTSLREILSLLFRLQLFTGKFILVYLFLADFVICIFFKFSPRQSAVAATMPHQEPKQQQIHPAQQQKRGVSYNRVYAFMSEAARQALTPEVPQGKK